MSLLADLRTKFQSWLAPRSLGQRGEDAAAKFLRKLGYVIVATQSSMNTSVAFAALVWISAVGLALYGLVVLVARLWAPWAEGID